MQPTPPPNLAPFLPPPPLPPPPPAPFWFSFCCLNWESGSIMSAQCFFLLFLMSHFVGILLGPPCYSLESLSLSLSLSLFFLVSISVLSYPVFLALPPHVAPPAPAPSLSFCISVCPAVSLQPPPASSSPRTPGFLGFSVSVSGFRPCLCLGPSLTPAPHTFAEK